MEWFNNIGKWFQENCNSFLMWLQTFDIVGLIAMIVMVIKQAIATKSNTGNVKLLTKALKENETVTTSLVRLKTENEELQTLVKTQDKKVNDVVDAADKILVKVNAMLDVFSLVYQTIKNEDTRVAVNNILMNARYNETATRKALMEKVEEMQQTVEQLMQDTSEKVNDVVNQSKQLLVAEDTDIPRG